ncbi:MAG: family 10 glycosylhydrolase [Muribaculaceae bacterium]|nr:family 10 glycosylhydrolase [Muribaculaceae bacterium]
MRKTIFMAMLALALACALPSRAQNNLKREFRGVWFTTMANIDWPQQRGTDASTVANQKASMLEYLDGFAATNINMVFFQVRPMADAFYQSSYEPWSSYLTGTRGKNPGWDPLAFCVEECHKRGMECHAWINPYRFANGNLSNWNTPQDEAVKNSGVLMTYNGTTIFNPGDPRSRERLVNVCRDIIEHYEIDGIIFDDYFYVSGTPATSDYPDYQIWKNSGSSMTFANWRRAQVNLMVSDVMNIVTELRPQMRFGIGPAGVAGTAATSASKHNVDPCPTGSDWQYSSLYSDPLAWLEEGTIDYISPQLYWKTTHSTNPFGPLTQWWSYIGPHFNRHYFASHNIYFMANQGEGNNTTSWNEILTQVRLTRQYNQDGAPGFNFYSSKYINGPSMSGLGNYMVQNLVPYKALPPAMTWRQGPSYGAPSGLAYDGSTLTWDRVDGSLIKYTVYAIPSNVSPQEASTENDGFKAEYLLGFTYNPSYTMPAAKASGCWYVVCVLDGYGNEYAPAYYGIPVDDADDVELYSPINSATVEWQQEFSWQEAQDATFRLQVSETQDFSSFVINQSGITTNTPTIDLSSLKSATTYYWRVITTQPSRLDKVSTQVGEFVTPQRDFAPVANLISPENGAEIEDNFLFLVEKGEGITNYRLELSKDPEFGTLITNNNMVDNGEAMQLDGIVAYLGLGTFYWRVATSAEGCDESLSAVRTFTVTAIGTGATEPGYVVKKDIDNATYEPIDGVKFTNDWVRSVKSEYDNMHYESSGTYNRSMAANQDYVFVTGREKNSSDADCYISVYSARTGEWVKDIELGDEVKASYFPCNDIFFDEAGHLLITNLVLNVGNYPILLCKVDPDTEEVTVISDYEIYCDGVKRIDHCNILGDVDTGNFTLFAAESRSNNIVQWVFKNGNLNETKVTTVSEFYPSNSASFETAPRILPIGNGEVYVNASGTKMARYSLATGAMTGSFATNPDIAPIGHQANGCAAIEFEGVNYMLYAYGDHLSPAGYQFILVANPDDTDYVGYTTQWIFPKQGLGMVNSTTMSAPCALVPGKKDNELRLFVMACGNGMAAYTMSLPVTVPGDVNGDGIVSGADVTALYNYLLDGRAVAGNPDVNGDGVVSGADVTALYNLLLN